MSYHEIEKAIRKELNGILVATGKKPIKASHIVAWTTDSRILHDTRFTGRYDHSQHLDKTGVWVLYKNAQ